MLAGAAPFLMNRRRERFDRTRLAVLGQYRTRWQLLDAERFGQRFADLATVFIGALGRPLFDSLISGHKSRYRRNRLAPWVCSSASFREIQ
jgi:hypothetical protein